MLFQTAMLLVMGTLSSGGLVAIAFLLRSHYNLRFLDAYAYFALVVAGYGLVNWIGPSLVRMIATADDVGTKGAVFLFVVVVVPLALIKLWLFLSLFAAMLEQPLNRGWARLLVLLGVVSLAVMSVTFYSDIGISRLPATVSFVTLFGVLVLALNFVAIFHFLASVDHIRGDDLRQHARRFGWAYLFGYLVYVFPYYLGYFVDLPWYTTFSPFAYYAMHLVPALFVWQFARQMHRDGRSRVTRASGIDGLVEKHQVSNREKAVLLLVNEGLNNSEIADQLSISPNTVRNHIYSIYRKLDVKNRAQLRRLCDG